MNRSEKYSYVYRLKLGDTLYFSRNTTIEEYSTFASGFTFFSAGSFSSLASILPIGSQVGRYTCLTPGLKTMGFRHPIEAVCMNSAVFNFARENIASYFDSYETRYGNINKPIVPTPQPQKAPIMVGNDVWIGSNVTISGGVTIGNGAVIASNSIVTKDVAPYSIIAGIPAKHKKHRFDKSLISVLEKIQWWNYELGYIYREELDFASPEKFIEKFQICAKNIRPLSLRFFYPYLCRFEDYQLAKNHIIDNHHNILFFDPYNKK